MPLFTLDELADAVEIIRPIVAPTPTYAWPLLAQRIGAKVFVKHENHTPTGAFKIRGGLVYVEALRRANALPAGFVTATRGNHGQSIAYAATRVGKPAIIVVPEGNSAEKNAAMAAWGGQLVISGRDFDEARPVAAQIAADKGYLQTPAFHHELVRGVATYPLELFQAAEDLDVVYVPIGMGSGVCATITVRDLLGLKTEIVGVVAENAPAFGLSFVAGEVVRGESANTFADGMACRAPLPEPLEILRAGASRVVAVSDNEIAEAMRIYYSDTHNVAEGAGAAPLAALMKERGKYAGKRVGLALSGGNVDASHYAHILSGQTPTVG
ncbi:MAG: threonine dehydratase [Neomegalonema sp.]|nr:threonine dehydratase [Neomegalonema sp.]